MSTSAHGDERTLTYWPALDGVRALAVTAVLLFHGGVVWLNGGFLGVDAFFVLSGFLITSLLLGEQQRSGRIRLGTFWLRRARRLLPALLVVVVVVVATFRDLVPRHEVGLLRGDALAALGYVANWRMIYRGDDYFTQTSAPSLLQHTWSLGIEEQFYLIWPLVVVALLVVGLVRARRVLVVLCLLGAAASAVAGALFFDPYDVNRSYFGTDTRAQALLIGCALAAALPSLRRRIQPRIAGGLTPLGVALSITALAAVVGVGVIWATADGTASWLYRGGFAVGGVAVAIILAQVVLQPGSVLAKVLGVAPLVWLGRISYGVYLWHWPLFALLNAERTGTLGAQLLLIRIGATIAVATVSYVVIEQPIRTGRLPFGLASKSPAWRPIPWRAGAGATAAVGVTAAFVVVGTLLPPVVTVTPIVVLPSAPPSTEATVTSKPTPMQRDLRKPGTQPRVTIFGDSVAWSLGTYLPEFPGITVTTGALPGCGIARLPEIYYLDEPHTNYEDCPTWEIAWQSYVDTDDPDVSVILLDRWELMDRKLGDKIMHVGDPLFDAYLTVELEHAMSIVASRGAHVVLLTAPYTHRWERPNGGLYDEDKPERVDAWNRLLRKVAADHPRNTTVIDLNRRVCPDGKFTWDIGRLQIRSDGLHFTPEGVQEWIAPWLIPQLATIAVFGPRETGRSD